jgi:VWFA-related protein
MGLRTTSSCSATPKRLGDWERASPKPSGQIGSKMRSQIWISLLCFALPLIAQQPGPAVAPPANPAQVAPKGLVSRTPADVEAARKADRRISLDVVVTDTSGKPVTGLMPQDFIILDNQRRQSLASFQAVQGAVANPPVEMILVLDTMNTSFQDIAVERREVEKYLTQNSGRLPLPVSIVYLSDYSAKVNQPSRDGRVLTAELDKLPMPMRMLGSAQGSPEGFNGLIRRFQLSLHTLTQLATYEATKPGRKMLVWIGRGWPMTEGQAFQYSSKEQAVFFSSIVDLSDRLREARVTLYQVAPADLAQGAGLRTFYYQNFLKGVRTVKEADSANLALPVLAYQTGGQIFINSKDDVATQLAACVADAQSFYSVSFDSVPAAAVNEYHALDVKIAKPGLIARTSTAYYAQP